MENLGGTIVNYMPNIYKFLQERVKSAENILDIWQEYKGSLAFVSHDPPFHYLRKWKKVRGQGAEEALFTKIVSLSNSKKGRIHAVGLQELEEYKGCWLELVQQKHITTKGLVFYLISHYSRFSPESPLTVEVCKENNIKILFDAEDKEFLLSFFKKIKNKLCQYQTYITHLFTLQKYYSSVMANGALENLKSVINEFQLRSISTYIEINNRELILKRKVINWSKQKGSAIIPIIVGDDDEDRSNIIIRISILDILIKAGKRFLLTDEELKKVEDSGEDMPLIITLLRKVVENQRIGTTLTEKQFCDVSEVNTQIAHLIRNIEERRPSRKAGEVLQLMLALFMHIPILQLKAIEITIEKLKEKQGGEELKVISSLVGDPLLDRWYEGDAFQIIKGLLTKPETMPVNPRNSGVLFLQHITIPLHEPFFKKPLKKILGRPCKALLNLVSTCKNFRKNFSQKFSVELPEEIWEIILNYAIDSGSVYMSLDRYNRQSLDNYLRRDKTLDKLAYTVMKYYIIEEKIKIKKINKLNVLYLMTILEPATSRLYLDYDRVSDNVWLH